VAGTHNSRSEEVHVKHDNLDDKKDLFEEVGKVKPKIIRYKKPHSEWKTHYPDG